jgi:hypothetical protein
VQEAIGRKEELKCSNSWNLYIVRDEIKWRPCIPLEKLYFCLVDFRLWAVSTVNHEHLDR